MKIRKFNEQLDDQLERVFVLEDESGDIQGVVRDYNNIESVRKVLEKTFGEPIIVKKVDGPRFRGYKVTSPNKNFDPYYIAGDEYYFG